MTEMSHGLYQCPLCFGTSEGPGTCRKCLESGRGVDYAYLERALIFWRHYAIPGDRLRSLYVTPSFTCPRCGMTSYNPTDISEGYCGNCHDWTRT